MENIPLHAQEWALDRLRETLDIIKEDGDGIEAHRKARDNLASHFARAIEDERQALIDEYEHEPSPPGR